MSLDDWLVQARADAGRRGLPELAPLLEALKTTLARLRAADWNDGLEGRVDASLGPLPEAAGVPGERGRRA